MSDSLSLDDILVGVQQTKPQFFCKQRWTGAIGNGRPLSTFLMPGVPGAAVPPDPGMAGEALTSYPGQIPFPAIAAGKTRYLNRFTAVYPGCGALWLCDRLWHNSDINVNSNASQQVNSVPWPARDANGQNKGEGVILAYEISSAIGTGTPTPTVTYTNSLGSKVRSTTPLISVSANSPQGSFYPFRLQGGDTGVQSIQSYQQNSSFVGGTIHLVAYRVLAVLSMFSSAGISQDILTSGRQQLFPNTVPFLVFMGATTTSFGLCGQIGYCDV